MLSALIVHCCCTYFSVSTHFTHLWTELGKVYKLMATMANCTTSVSLTPFMAPLKIKKKKKSAYFNSHILSYIKIGCHMSLLQNSHVFAIPCTVYCIDAPVFAGCALWYSIIVYWLLYWYTCKFDFETIFFMVIFDVFICCCLIPFYFHFLTAGCKPNCPFRIIKLPWILNTCYSYAVYQIYF